MFEHRPAHARPLVAASPDWADRAVQVSVWTAAFLVSAAFLAIVGDLVSKGLPHVSWAFLTQSPLDGGRAGGIAPVIVSTGLILAVCLAVAAPIGLGTAILLAEFTRSGRIFAQFVRRSLDVLAGVPSIVFGLFGNAFFSIYLGMGFSILAGGLTLACMVLPILIRTIEASFRNVPDDYRRAAAALGVPRSVTLWQVLLPAATPGLVVGLVLGIGRALAETAALLFTSGYVARMPESLTDSGRTLSIHIYELAMNVPGGEYNAYATAVTLIVLILLINIVASSAANRWLHRKITPI